jgi:Cu(I)/Ag(I) efflux system membrane fusion protein
VKIDGAIQLRAGRNMMALDPDAPAPARAALPADLAAAWEAAFARYLSWQAALAADRAGEARAAAGALAAPGEEPPAAGAPEPWASALAGMRAAARSGAAAADLAAARAAFEPASGAVRDLLDAFGPPAGRAAFLLFCPMAFDNRGAEWVQDAPAVRNPYFGAAMLACGEVRKEYAAAAPPAEDKTRRDE